MARDRRVLIRRVSDHFFLVPSLLVWEQIDPCREYEFEGIDDQLWTSFTTEEGARRFASRYSDSHHKPSSVEVIDFDPTNLKGRS